MKQLICAIILIVMAGLTGYAQSVGDVIEKDGVAALIIHVDETGMHGLLMSLPNTQNVLRDQMRHNKAQKNKYGMNLKNINLKRQQCLQDIFPQLGENGKHNAEVMKNYCRQKNLPLEDIFPAQAWAASLGDDWYIPSREEFIYYSYAIGGNGLGREHYQKKDRRKLIDKRTNLSVQLFLQSHLCVPESVWSSYYTKDEKGNVKPCCFGMITGGYWYNMIRNWSHPAFTCAVCEF